MFRVKLSDIAAKAEREFGAKCVNCDVDLYLTRAVPISDCSIGTITFANSVDVAAKIDRVKGALVIAPRDFAPKEEGCSAVLVENPRLVFGLIVGDLYQVEHSGSIHPSAVVDQTAKLGSNVSIGANTVIGPYCSIGDNVTIHHNVVIDRAVIIGRDSSVLSGSVIGEAGFGVETAKDGKTFRLPHIGGVVIGERVVIGSMNSIAAGTLVPTVIEDDVQTDNLVHIAHNVRVGASTLITACAEISGSVTIGARSWIGPNASIMNKVSIGEDAMIGLGAVVTKSVPGNTIVAGSPARILRLRHKEEQ
ncbi:UDP-3-O-(3-hydroxymyristoyl)glucosamine N-acyltransferase [Marivivens sp. LCG002]|uniref:UDP-3-O-(3-hydroxymyristoyl)glucosamine N-acyltransferase n=1 Tax=Marivivens sp. LCG002 TaxID=3051171 RepID=UPI0025534BAE|nr:UDP-3-O-(3-hydroxymyristoyl)glucosamine N-acyltransferase [Marivivens sp. LCG002]WIV51403.1 UDP-3-O-(3-hydroxymyristoyl)glucosamine N-acyltransferase [Marivivens sp. LCG002]